MFWHIDTDIVSLIVMAALYACTILNTPRVKRGASDRSFIICLRAGLLMTAIDILASVIMEVPTTRFWYHLLMTAYFATLELVIVAWFYYSLSILYHDDEKRRKRATTAILIPYAAYVLFICLNPWTETLYSLGPSLEYERGALFLPVVVGVYAIYTVSMFIVIFARRKHIPKDYPKSVLPITPLILALSIPVQLLNPGWLMILPAYMICMVLAFLFFESVRIRNDRAQLRQLTELTENFSSGLAICSVATDGSQNVQYLSNGISAICEEDAASLLERYRRDLLSGVHPDDRERVAKMLLDVSNGRKDAGTTYRFINSGGKTKWLNVKAKIARRDDGTATVYATYTDLTEQKELECRLADLIQNVPCGICLYTWDGCELRPILVNSKFSEMLGEDALEHLEGVDYFNYTHVHPDDLEALRRESYAALTESRKLDMTYRSLNVKTGEYLWIRLRGKVLPRSDGSVSVFVSYNDVTQEHMVEAQLLESEQALEYATVQAGLRYWRYDAARDITYPDARNQRDYNLPPVMENTTGDWLDRGFIMPEFVPEYRSACLKIKNGAKQAIVEARAHAVDGSAHWYRFCLTNLFGEDGKPTITVGTSMNIDTEKELWAKYELERRRMALEGDNLLVRAILNLTTGETLEYAYHDGAEVPVRNRDAFAYCRDNAELLIDAEERARFLALNDRNALISSFERGETELRMDYRRLLITGEVRWVRSIIHLVRDPRGGDILLFEYWYDIEEEKMTELMYKSIASDNYDFVARIDGRSRHFWAYPNPKAGSSFHMPPEAGEDADEVTRHIYEQCASPEEKQIAIENSLVANIKNNLREHGRFYFTYRALLPNGEMRHKKVAQYYIDPQREIIAMLREDVTELIREETEKNQILASALDAANLASRSKSQFLSRVSHELRTPLNAIIGFMSLAKDAEPSQAERYLANSDAAAKQLLSVINDVLDMSSIESGKLKIAHSPFDFKHMLASITNIYVPLCRDKGLAYDTKLLTPIDEWLIGDQLRVNQILLNLLGNAVKFTEKGFVRLSVSQTEAGGEKTFMRFEVSDSGCGMSDDMRARLFRPFEQESAGIARKYGGNGLGLSIVSSLVTMMGGAISVSSRQGEGSTFTVDLPLAKCETHCAASSLKDAAELHVLSVDDEAREREYISTVLQRMGVRNASVQNGAEALAELERAEAMGDCYNLCLIDWKMPDMSGMEITRRIRAKYGSELIVIVVSAYEHYQAEESARAAGANMFISKPLFQSSLFDLFSTITGGRVSRKQATREAAQFAGKRVLLAEDNQMNRMVAEGLVKKIFNIECDCAEDGRVAVEKFVSSAPGYYDAILMDIQMPVMDGFEATRRIRASAHPDAERVSIIALTANAFNEDIAKTLSSGMNAHVAKPIEPDVLAAALGKAFAGES